MLGEGLARRPWASQMPKAERTAGAAVALLRLARRRSEGSDLPNFGRGDGTLAVGTPIRDVVVARS